MKRILIIEDDTDLLFGLKANLQLEGYEVDTATDGQTGLARALQTRPDCIILDVMLPEVNGFDVCRTVRERGLGSPVLMLSARGQDTDKMRGLDLGADDYVTKPFSIIDLLARVRAILRRASEPKVTLDMYTFDNVEINFRLMQARKGKRPVALSGLEFEVLRHLVLRRGEVVSRDQLLHEVWGYCSTPVTRSVDNVVTRLRQKLESRPSRPHHILTIRGSGYKFVS